MLPLSRSFHSAGTLRGIHAFFLQSGRRAGANAAPCRPGRSLTAGIRSRGQLIEPGTVPGRAERGVGLAGLGSAKARGEDGQACGGAGGRTARRPGGPAAGGRARAERTNGRARERGRVERSDGRAGVRPRADGRARGWRAERVERASGRAAARGRAGARVEGGAGERAEQARAQRARRSTTAPKTRGIAAAAGTMRPRAGEVAAARRPAVSIRKSRVDRDQARS